MTSQTADSPRLYPRHCQVHIHTFVVRGGTVAMDRYSLEEFLGDGVRLDDTGHDFRWVHLPVNSMAWVEVSLDDIGNAPLWP